MNRQAYPNELYHYGILGQKWGVRRFQNPDGSLTEAGKKRVSKEFDKTFDAGYKKYAKTGPHLNAYNRAADEMNNGMIDKFNKKHWKPNMTESQQDDYVHAYENLFEEIYTKHQHDLVKEFSKTSPEFKFAEDVLKKYGSEFVGPKNEWKVNFIKEHLITKKD